MNLLIINELRVCGGTEVQTEREFQLFRKNGFSVSLLTFDPNLKMEISENSEGKYNIPVSFGKMEKMVHRLIQSRKYNKLIEQVLEIVKPDYIHVNNLKNLSLDVYKAVRKYKTVQTIRDYGFICPKDTCIMPDGVACLGYMYGDCSQCIKGNLELKFKSLILPRLNKIRVNSVNRFVSPSNALSTASSQNGLDTTCVNNPFDISIVKKTEMAKSPVFLYYGKISEEKGVSILIKAFEVVHREFPDAVLWMIGNVAPEYKSQFAVLTEKEFIQYKGTMSNSEVMEIYESVYCVIVPSLWLENYPNTVLESIANKTLVIGSNRGGIPELIGDERFLFDILDEKDLISKIKYAYQLPEEEYVRKTNERYKWLLENNSLDTYYLRLLETFNSIE